MQIKNLKIVNKLQNKKNTLIKSGTALILAGVLFLSNAPSTLASTNINDVTIMPPYTEEEKNRRENESLEIESRFKSEPLSRIEESLRLSDVINMNIPKPHEHENVSLDEVLTTNIDSLYEEMCYADATDTLPYFAYKYMDRVAAIDAYTCFSCYTVCEELKRSLVDIVLTRINTNGSSFNSEPKVVISSNEVYVILDYNVINFKVDLTGTIVDEIKDVYLSLNDKYTIAKNNICGYSDDSENSFAFQGKDNYSSSVYLSLPDDQRKGILNKAINIINKIKANGFQTTARYTYENESIDERTIDQMLSLGFNFDEIAETKQVNIEVNSNVPSLSFK